MFSPIGGAYNLLRQVKGNYPEAKPLFNNNKHLMQRLAKAPFDAHDKDTLVEDLNMKYRQTDNEEEASRRAVLTISDAFELIAVWDWLYRLHKGLPLDEYDGEIQLMGRELSRLIRAVDDHPSVTLSGTREIGKSVAASYIAHKDKCLEFLGSDVADRAYKIRVNLVFKYYLDLPPMYDIEESEDGI